MKPKIICPRCRHPGIDKGRAPDGRRAYRCQKCNNLWTEGMQGREKNWSEQRQGFQFKEGLI
jgi:transposase-like protein